jgi:hypothetical protein
MKYVLVFLSVFSLVTISNVASQVTTRPTKIILTSSPNPATIPTIPATISATPATVPTIQTTVSTTRNALSTTPNTVSTSQITSGITTQTTVSYRLIITVSNLKTNY